MSLHRGWLHRTRLVQALYCFCTACVRYMPTRMPTHLYTVFMRGWPPTMPHPSMTLLPAAAPASAPASCSCCCRAPSGRSAVPVAEAGWAVGEAGSPAAGGCVRWWGSAGAEPFANQLLLLLLLLGAAGLGCSPFSLLLGEAALRLLRAAHEMLAGMQPGPCRHANHAAG